MSTRCQIGIYEKTKTALDEPDILLYRHSDGYPDTDGGVLADLIPFLKAFRAQRGDDVQFCGAQLLHHLMKAHDKVIGKYYANDLKHVGKYAGYGIDRPGEFHGDIEYYYAVYPNAVKVYSVRGHGPDDWTKVKTVKIMETKIRPIDMVELGDGRADFLV